MPALLPNLTLPIFEGPLDLLLHLVREHRLDISDIPISLVTDQYLACLRTMQQQDLTLAGEFFVMAATLLEIKSRMLLPKPPTETVGEDEIDDPRAELALRLQEYGQFKELVPLLQELESDRGNLFFRSQADYGDLYELPVEYGSLSADLLLRALARVLSSTDRGEAEVTSVHRQRLTLSLAMHGLLTRVRVNGVGGLLFDDAFDRTYSVVRLDVIMVFLALLELLRRAKLRVVQEVAFGQIMIYPLTLEEPAST